MKKTLSFLCLLLICSRGSGQDNSPESPIPWDGFELFAYLSSKFPVKIVTDFSAVEHSSRGIIVILGNETDPTLPWERVEKWVKGGGRLLAACDEKPDKAMDDAISRLTGYQWGKLLVKQKSPKGLDSLPRNFFEGNNFVIGAEWNKPRGESPGIANLLPPGLLAAMADPPARVYLNRAGILSLTQPNPFTFVFGKYPDGLELFSRVLGKVPNWQFNPVYGCLAQTAQGGVVIQLADQDIFSNQMLELRENVEFAWWCLETLCKEESQGNPDPIPMLLVVRGRAQASYQLPAPPLPLPDLDPYTAASLATRALDEILPSWETPDGPFAQFSDRITSENYSQNAIGILAIFLFFAGIYLIFRFRGRVRARETASQSASDRNLDRKSRSRERGAGWENYLALRREFESMLDKWKLSFWEISDLKWAEKNPGSDPQGVRKWERMKKEVLGFFCRDQQSLQNARPSDCSKIRGQMKSMDEYLKKGLAVSTKAGMTKGVSQA